MAPRGWPQEEVIALREYAAQGLSAAEIAVQLGKTRNQVIGVIARHRIPLGRRTSTLPMKDYTPIPKVVVATPKLWPKPDTPTMVPFTETQDHHCRMPLWSDKHHGGNVCGRQRTRKSYYCAECQVNLWR